MIEKQNSSSGLYAWSILLFLAVIWGLSFLFIKKIVVVLTPIELGAGRVFFASIFLIPWVLKGLKTIPKEKYNWLVGIGLLGNLFPAFIFSLVGSKLNSSLAGTLNSTTPIFVLIIGALFFASRILKFQIIGIIVGFTGSLILVFTGNTEGINFANPYALLAMSATLMYGFNVNIVSKYLGGLKPLQMTAVAFFFVGIVAMIVLSFTDFYSKILAPENRVVLYYLICLAGVNTSLALVLFNYMLQISSPVFASSVTYLVPIVATVAGLFDGELISIWHYLGMSVILIGVYLINKKET
ncbi:DMT family transporter [uncultured Arcticibacterium sp.]|uniref:DMT family transporter n=1 Tax=uncultured Arcticibacterium sp. TaxID=2173042 RepID=UPI0030F92834